MNHFCQQFYTVNILIADLTDLFYVRNYVVASPIIFFSHIKNLYNILSVYVFAVLFLLKWFKFVFVIFVTNINFYFISFCIIYFL